MPTSTPKKQSSKDNKKNKNGDKSPFFRPSTPVVEVATPGGVHHVKIKQSIKEHKSSLLGTSANLINAIVGSGIVGIPYAMQQSGLVGGIVLVVFVAALTEKSLRLLIETAKHVNTPSYETLIEACFGRFGFFFVSLSMFVMAYGAMVSYLMIVKDTLPVLFGITDIPRKRGMLFLISLCVMVPISSQRDMADLAKTSRLSVIFDLLMVLLVVYTSPWIENLTEQGMSLITSSTLHMDTVFVGVGVLSFAFVCQHSAFIIAGSLERPTRSRWASSTKMALSFCVVLASLCGFTGYAGYQEHTMGNILNNLPDGTWSANLARGLLGITMLFVYPMESFVARHVCVVTFFKGRRAHEGEDAAILNRRDRRITLTFVLYVLAILPALLFEDLGIVLAVTGCVGGSCLSYIGPGAAYLGVHGGAFLEMVQEKFGVGYWKSSRKPKKKPIATLAAVEGTGKAAISSDEQDQKDPWYVSCWKTVVWYAFAMPLWCSVAELGVGYLELHVAEEEMKSPHPLRIGNVHHETNGARGVQMTARRQRDATTDEEEGQPLITRQESLHLIGQRNVLPPSSSYQHSLSSPNMDDPAQQEDMQDRLSRTAAAAAQAAAKQPLEQKVEEEEDPQADPPQVVDFLIAVGYILFGLLAIGAGLVSILAKRR